MKEECSLIFSEQAIGWSGSSSGASLASRIAHQPFEQGVRTGPENLPSIENPEMLILSRFGQALASLLDSSLLQIDDGGVYVKCHRLVHLAVVESLSASTNSSVFNRVIIKLNAACPSQSDGRPLHDPLHKCEVFSPQLAGSSNHTRSTRTT